MNVIHVVISLAPGGLERLVVDWTNARNHQQPGSTRICCLDERGALAGQVAESKGQGAEGNPPGGAVVCVDAHRSRWPFDLAAVRRIQTLSTRGSVHAHNLAAWQYAVLAKISRNPFRLIYTQHGANVHNLGLRDRVRARLLACFTDEIVAVSDATAESMSAKLWIARKRIRVIANGVRAQNQPIPAGARGNPIVIGSVGRLAQVKGYDRLIRAFAAFIRLPLPPDSPSSLPHLRVADATLLLVGDGPERGALERQAQQLGVADRVTFAGYQANPTPILARMDLFVLPSRSEGMSVALLEAMAAGIPVAATEAGANREILNDGACGTMLTDDESQWASLMRATLQDQGATAAKAEAARQRVQEHYSLQTTLTGYERLYAGMETKQPC